MYDFFFYMENHKAKAATKLFMTNPIDVYPLPIIKKLPYTIFRFGHTQVTFIFRFLGRTIQLQ